MKGIVTLVILSVIFAIVITTIFVLIFPLLVNLNANFYDISQNLVNDYKDVISEHGFVNESISELIKAQKENINILTIVWKYSPYLIVILVTVFIFMWARRNVEYPSV